MTVPTTTNKAIGTGDGVATVFPFTFGTLPSGDLVVTLIDLAGVETVQIENTDYTLVGIGQEDGGSVVFVTPPANLWTVLIQRILPVIQPTDFKNQGSFYPRTHERSFDRGVMIDQQLNESDGRTIKIPAHVQGVSTTLPVPVGNGIWGWDAAAQAPRYFSPGEIATAAIAQNWRFVTFTGDGIVNTFTLPDDPGSIANMDVSIDGVTQVPATDYTLNGTLLTFSPPPANGAVILVRYGTALAQGIGATFQLVQTNVTAGQTVVSLPSVASGAVQQVYIDGILQSPNTYVVVGQVITFSEAVPSDCVVVAMVADGAYAGAVSTDGIAHTAAYTGAATRTQRNRNDDQPFVTDFGVIGDGVTDTLSALQGAINSGAPDLYFPAGTYVVGARLKPVSNQRWHGVKGRTTIILSAAAASSADLVMLNADGAEGSLDNWHADGIIFDGNHKNAAFLLHGCNNVSFTDCDFQNSGTYGCAFQARPGFTITLPQDGIRMLRCRLIDNGSDAPGWDGLDIKWCTNSKFIDCEATGNTDAGINIRGRSVEVVGCSAAGNGTAGILLQSNDSTEDSQINVVGGAASGTTAGPGLEIQGNSGRNTFINVDGFQTYSNTGDGLRISGSGKVIGTVNGFQSRSNTADGVNVGGDFVGSLRFNGGLITSNGGDGFDNTGKNCVLDGVNILANAGTGYIERTGADNNYVMPNCVISGNGTDIGARVGTETDDGFVSVRDKNTIRLFPGTAQGLEMRTDSGGTWGALAAVGDAASIDLRLISKGNGDIGLYKDNGTRQIALFREAGTATVNFIDFIASLTATPVIVQASGTDTNIDLQLNPKGTGNVRFGTFTSNADAPVTGYITVKDAAGNARKLAIIA